MRIRIDLEENPKGTHQQKGVSVQGGRPHFYEKGNIRALRQTYQSSKRTSESDRRSALSRLFNAVEEDGIANITEMIAYANGEPSEASIRRYIKEFADEYEVVKRGFIRKSVTS